VCHLKQAVPDSKGKACRMKKIGEEDRKVARSDCATTHDRATVAGWAQSARAEGHGRAPNPAIARSARV